MARLRFMADDRMRPAVDQIRTFAEQQMRETGVPGYQIALADRDGPIAHIELCRALPVVQPLGEQLPSRHPRRIADIDLAARSRGRVDSALQRFPRWGRSPDSRAALVRHNPQRSGASGEGFARLDLPPIFPAVEPSKGAPGD